MRIATFCGFVVLVTAAAAETTDGGQRSRLMTPRDLKGLSALPADYRFAYGPEANQFGELRTPVGPGPHPVVVLIHGGCFKLSDLRDLAPMADALKAEGIASWNVEYRRVIDPGGGWPGTYLDVGKAIDHLRTLAPVHHLDLRRVVLVGHSAGGHLALWAASRSKLRKSSSLHTVKPLVPAGVINLAGPIDLSDNVAHYETLCRDTVITKLTGGTPVTMPERYAEGSPNRRLPLGVPQVLIWGEYENFVPQPFAQAHVAAAKRAGDTARLVVIPGAGHFEIASPRAFSWSTVKAEIVSLLPRRAAQAAGEYGTQKAH
jgi:acetyl esterase/lipase